MGQQHYFNTPFQLSLPPTELQSEVLADRPDAADQYAFSVEDGDVILLATDGIFDNVPDRLLVEEMDKVQHCKDEVVLQQSANTIALMARRLSRDAQFLSPFSINALAAGIEAGPGGKPDDITVIDLLQPSIISQVDLQPSIISVMPICFFWRSPSHSIILNSQYGCLESLHPP